VCVCVFLFFWWGWGVPGYFVGVNSLETFFLVSLKREREAGREGEREEECAFFLSFLFFQG
jgi:hypothetical protein